MRGQSWRDALRRLFLAVADELGAVFASAEVLVGNIWTGRSEFQIGTLLVTGLPTGNANGLMCVDAVQFAEPPLAALLEFRRVLASGGRLVLSCWEAVDPSDGQVPPRIHAVNLRRDLPAAGFVEVQVHDQPEWREAERTMWKEMVAAQGDSDSAVRSLQTEGRRSLETFASWRRVFATATAP